MFKLKYFIEGIRFDRVCRKIRRDKLKEVNEELTWNFFESPFPDVEKYGLKWDSKRRKYRLRKKRTTKI